MNAETAKPSIATRLADAVMVVLGRRSIEDPNTPLSWAQVADVLGGPASASGKRVTPETALRISAVKACVTAVSESIAMLPLVTYRRLSPRGKERAVDDTRYELLKLRPNPESSSFAYAQAMVSNTMLWGNSIAAIVRDGRGTPVELWPIEAPRIKPGRLSTGELVYEVMPSPGSAWASGGRLLKRDVLHVPALTLDGIWGRSPIADARDSIGTAMAQVEFQGKFYRNSARPGGLLEHPAKLSDRAEKKLRESWNAIYGGSANAGTTAVLEEGMKFNPLTMPLEDAQFIETMKFGVSDIARIFRVPPHKIGDLDRSTNNNIEQQSLDFLTDCLQPWVTRIEQEANWKLFTPEERASGLFCEHLLTAILRTDMKSRAEFASKLFLTGALSPDDIRELENQNPLPDNRGAVHFVPSNVIPAPTPEQADGLIKKAGSTPPPPQPPPTPPPA